MYLLYAPARRLALVGLIATAALCACASPSAASGTSTISGTVFYDTNRSGMQDAGEAPLPAQGIALLDATGQSQVAYTASDALGHYRFSGLAAGDYRVAYDAEDWWALRQNWVPTTTGSLFPQKTVTVSWSATVDFGWRAIVRSATYLAPMTTYTWSCSALRATGHSARA